MYQSIAWQLSLILMGALLAVFLFVALRARERVADSAPLITRAYRIRTTFFWALLLVLIPVMLYSLVDLPYANATNRQGGAVQVIDVLGQQWSWTLSANDVVVGTPVEFRVTSSDVNHGLGIYDESMQLLTQTMAMPGYTNSLRYTFDRPGTYKLLCLEYCGLAHHSMIAELNVGAVNTQEPTHD